MTAGHAQSVGNDIVVPLRSRRAARAAFLQPLQHVIPAAGLLFSGVQSLSAGAHGLELALALAGMLTSGLLIAAFGASLRGLRDAHAQPRAHGVDWLEIWAAGVLLAEAAERWHVRRHFPGPQLLTAAATLSLGLFHGRLTLARQRRRSLRVTHDHVFVGRNRFSHFTARWDEIADLVVTDREATIRTHRGRRRRLNLADLENAAAVKDALQIARARLAASRLEKVAP